VSEKQATGLMVRAGRSEDAETCGLICYEAFKAIQLRLDRGQRPKK
jgi:hypothetical protein